MNESPAKRANMLLVLLILINIINMVDRNLISSFGPEITKELNLSDTQFGYLTGLLFVFFYAIMGLFVGRLADMVHRPRLIAVGLFVWSALTIFSGAARSFLQIGVARLFLGSAKLACRLHPCPCYQMFFHRAAEAWRLACIILDCLWGQEQALW